LLLYNKAILRGFPLINTNMEETTMAEFFAKFEAIWQEIWAYIYAVLGYWEEKNA
jgi:hypothetical protein